MLAALFAALHYVALGLGVAGLWIRGRGFRAADLPTALHGDTLWGLAALLWLGTGLGRAFGGLEKGTDWYLHQPLFWVKMALFLGILLVELWPMVSLIRWRIDPTRVDPALFPTFSRLNNVEGVLLAAMPFVASAMARGIGG